ncbi:helix-turn-helix domain-containing protein [Streptomyces sp. NPDC015220]|uniref:helix-turn-helix domain-containing protein n=1 Tax=Streptomyces sp. NPDC015220 TaxID=3364947 RepID=UPI003701E88C
MITAPIGDRLRELRVADGLSLRALAARTGLSPALLSQVERGVTDPSLATLRRLADAHRVPLAGLFAPGSPRTRAASCPTAATPGVPHERLTPADSGLGVFRTALRPGETTGHASTGCAATACVYVLTGTLTADLDGAARTLRAGEALTVAPGVPRRYLNGTDTTVEFLIITGPSMT